jgi:EpsI family protein
MGTKQEIKLIVLAGVFLATALLVHGGTTATEIPDKTPLAGYFRDLPGYTPLRDIELIEEATSLLQLDDYLFTYYAGPSGPVNLYIGYYYTAGKASAAHSPLICYPSQGWKIAEQPAGYSRVVGGFTLEYEEITTAYGGQQELVLYWYQTYARTQPKAYRTKIDIAFNKLLRRGEQHAFVRISVPYDDNREEAQAAAMEFIRVFFPRLVEFFTEA